MRRNNKLIIIAAVAAVIVLGTLLTLFISGNGISNRFLGKNAEPQESTTKVESTAESTVPQENATPKPGEGQTAENNTDGTGTETDKKDTKDIKAKAIYLTGISAGNKKSLEHAIELCKTTELNAVVIDVKEAGKVNYKSDIPEVNQYGALSNYYDVDEVLKTLHDNNIYVIGRVVTFCDSVLANKRNDLAVKRKNGTVFKESIGAWINAHNQEAWKYNIEIAKEAAKKGFDEIQFDYVRFPAGPKSWFNYGENPPQKADSINGFLKLAEKELHENLGVPVSADIFGIVCESPGDTEGIGQVLEQVGLDIDFISPMIYPSHYANAAPPPKGNGVGQSINGVVFKAPDMDPYGVIYNALLGTKNRIEKVPNYKAKVRPYLQAFNAPWLPKGYYQQYGAKQVQEQIKAVYDAGYEEWILWDPKNIYKEEYFNKEKAE